jgi:hypothetical protein
MKLSGIMKLRLVITIAFLVLLTSVLISIWTVTIDFDAETDFYEKLTWEDENDLERIFAKYPDTGTTSILIISGYMIYFVTAILGFLTWKVWNVKKIK